MKKECDQHPTLIHTGCQTDKYEDAVATYFKDLGLTVERLCTALLSNGERGPDFRIGDETFTCLLEVKHLDSPRGAATVSDRNFQVKQEYADLRVLATAQQVIVTKEQWQAFQGQIPYPSTRNTSIAEQNYAKEVEKRVIAMLQKHKRDRSDLHFSVSIRRFDQWVWTSEETDAFVKYLVDGILAIQSGHFIPQGWNIDPIPNLVDSTIAPVWSSFRQKRPGDLYVQNLIELTPIAGELTLQFDTPALDLNIKSARDQCRDAQRQIRSGLQRVSGQQQLLSRMIMIILDFDIIDHYIPDIGDLQSLIRDRFNPDLCDVTTLVFVHGSDNVQRITLNSCTVFHLPRPDLPRVPSHAFAASTTNQIEITA